MHDEFYIYVFVRQDISLAEQLVHAAHAAYHAGNGLWYPILGKPSLVVIGVPHVGSLAKVCRKLSESAISFYPWEDPDTEYGLTAIATDPISRQQKDVLNNYRLWKYAGGPEQSACSPTADSGPTAPVAQAKEHSVSKSNGEVGSSILSGGSTIEGTCCEAQPAQERG